LKELTKGKSEGDGYLGNVTMAIVTTNRKWFIILTTAAITTFLVMTINSNRYERVVYEKHSIILVEKELPPRTVDKNWRGLDKKEIDKLSVLGRILYMGEEPPLPRTEKTFQILMWKYGKTIENRHLKHFGSDRIDPFEHCSVKNCEITYDDKALESADIVIFHLHRMVNGELPKTNRSSSQIWAFLTDESPFQTFLGKNSLINYNGVFNWSMTYRMDSDIPVPYGRTVLRTTPPTQNLTLTKKRDVLVAIMGSNCGGRNHRWNYVRELQKHIAVDTYGGCGKLKTCPGHFKANCRDIDDYMFYLSFENSNCDGYATEKVWWNAYEKNSIPIVMGASQENYRKLLPPRSYLNIDDYAHPKDLATYIRYLNSTGKYSDYYAWKLDFEVLNEHGYFQSKSYHYCRVCEALNYNDKRRKVYQDLGKFWNASKDCHPAWDA
jgi:glycoprotein 3-alpha-L-fucosyltransferase